MYKVLIIDNDSSIRVEIKSMVNWKALDCEAVTIPMDVGYIKELFQQTNFEIVILDFDYHKEDCMELMHFIKQEKIQTQILAISIYDDFDSVRIAMKEGAFDFLRKQTLEKHELEDVIVQVQKNCEMNIHTTNLLMNKAFDKLQQCLILKKNHHAVKVEEFENVLHLSAFDKYRDFVQVAYFRIDNIHLIYKKEVLDHSVLRQTLERAIQDVVPVPMEYRIIFISNHSGIIMFHHSEKLRIASICHTIIHNVFEVMNMHLSITLSDILHSLREFYDCYTLLLESHDMRFYVGEGVLIQISELASFQPLDYNAIDCHVRIIQQLGLRNFTDLGNIKLEALIYMKQNFIKPIDVKNYFVFIFNNIEGNEIEKGMQNAYHFDTFNHLIEDCETIDMLDEILNTTFQSLKEWFQDKSQNRYRKDIMEIITFIDDNYTRKISLNMIAAHFNINESYLSRIFKVETGKTLIYFINERKMKKAMELLSDPNIMIKEAAYQVGIEDQFYFNKVFKKFYDVSPSEFRKKVKTELERA